MVNTRSGHSTESVEVTIPPHNPTQVSSFRNTVLDLAAAGAVSVDTLTAALQNAFPCGENNSPSTASSSQPATASPALNLPSSDALPSVRQITHMPFRPVEISFAGRPDENVNDYIEIIESEGKAMGLSSEQMARTVCSTTRGRAFFWFKEQTDAIKNNWNRMKNALIEKFASTERDFSSIVQLRERTQGRHESVHEYTKAILSLCDKIAATDHMRLQFYVLGLREPLRTKVGRKSPNSFDEAERYALQFEKEGMHAYGGSDDQLTEIKQQQVSTSKQLADLQSTLSTLVTNQVAALRPEQQAARQKTTTERRVTCFKCHKEGHVQSECRMNLKCGQCGRKGHATLQCRSKPKTTRPMCNHCGRLGHEEEQCFSKQKN